MFLVSVGLITWEVGAFEGIVQICVDVLKIYWKVDWGHKRTVELCCSHRSSHPIDGLVEHVDSDSCSRGCEEERRTAKLWTIKLNWLFSTCHHWTFCNIISRPTQQTCRTSFKWSTAERWVTLKYFNHFSLTFHTQQVHINNHCFSIW